MFARDVIMAIVERIALRKGKAFIAAFIASSRLRVFRNRKIKQNNKKPKIVTVTAQNRYLA